MGLIISSTIFFLVNILIVIGGHCELGFICPVAVAEWMNVPVEAMVSASLLPVTGLRSSPNEQGAGEPAGSANVEMPPTISVILPVYNGARHLQSAVQSIFDQTYRDFEIVAIDDGSRDRCAEILNQLAARDARMRVISRENRGFVATLNQALSLSRGRYVARMDQDDISQPHRFERQLERMEAEPDLVALGSRVIAIDPDNRVLGLERLPLTHEEIEKWHLTGQSAICHPASMMRTQAMRAINGYREVSPVEDFDFWLRLGEIGRLANIEEPLFKYRRSTTGMVATYAPKRIAMLEQVMREVWQRRHLPGEPCIPRQKLKSSADIYRQWAWWAMAEGHAGTARAHAWKALKAQPLAWNSWWLMACSLRQPRQHSEAA